MDRPIAHEDRDCDEDQAYGFAKVENVPSEAPIYVVAASIHLSILSDSSQVAAGLIAAALHCKLANSANAI
jgi:hypothetical protein